MKDIIIIGGGIAGLTAAVYALRSGKSVLLFEKKAYGCQTCDTSADNYYICHTFSPSLSDFMVLFYHKSRQNNIAREIFLKNHRKII